MSHNEQKRYALTESYLQYRRGEKSWTALKEEAEQYSYHIARRFFGNRDDQFTCFIMQVFHRIPDLIYDFRWCGAPLEHYLTKSIVMRCKTIAGRYQKKRHHEKIQLHCNCTGPAPEARTLYSSPELGKEELTCSLSREARSFFHADPRGRVKKSAQRKQLLIFAMKGASNIDDTFTNAICAITGEDPGTLTEQITRCRETIMTRQGRYRTMQHRRNRIFTQMIEVQIQLASCSDPEEKEQFREKNRILRARLEKVQHYLRHRTWLPSHKELAVILGIPKGTISSSMHKLKELAPELWRGREAS